MSDPPLALPPDPAAAPPSWRLRRANREAVVPVPARWDGLLPADHLARRLWDLVGRLDLTAFYVLLQVVEGGPGAAAIDPRILVTLWLYATSPGVTSARALAVLCVEHLAYIWICGGVAVNYHTRSDFRVAYEDELDALLTPLLAQLDQAELVDLTTQAQDGLRGRPPFGGSPRWSRLWPKPRNGRPR